MLLPHQDPTPEVRLRDVVAPCHEPGNDLADLVEPRRGIAAEVEFLEGGRVGECRMSKDHSWRAAISRVRPLGDHFVPSADDTAATFRPFAMLRRGGPSR